MEPIGAERNCGKAAGRYTEMNEHRTELGSLSHLSGHSGGRLTVGCRTRARGLTQPTIARHLDASLGLELFVRSQQGLSPT
jgi:hypothetical protein